MEAADYQITRWYPDAITQAHDWDSKDMEQMGASWPTPVTEWLQQEEYGRAIVWYEDAIEAQPEAKDLFWQLGLVRLLQGQEMEAQTTWLLGMADGDATAVDQWTLELSTLLQQEAERQEAAGQIGLARLIRFHLREINPGDLDNVLHLVRLSAVLQALTLQDFDTWQLIPALAAAAPGSVDTELLLAMLQQVLGLIILDRVLVKLMAACVPHCPDITQLLSVVLPSAIKISYSLGLPDLAAELLEPLHTAHPENVAILSQLALFYQNAGLYEKGIQLARRCVELAQRPEAEVEERVFAAYLEMRGLVTAGGYWREAQAALPAYESLLLSLPADGTGVPNPFRILNAPFFLPYLRDDPVQNRTVQQHVMTVFERAARRSNAYPETGEPDERRFERSARTPDRPLKVGYLSYALRRHSVGFLTRSLFKHHDRERVELYGYFINRRHNDPLQEWYFTQFQKSVILDEELDNKVPKLAERIQDDGVEVLVDLDSITLDLSCELLALKPAPVQVSWLGWDAPGLPSVDYFIVDPYVVPEQAQDYYAEKLWRLPQTYIAVDGFEVGAPGLRRADLDIPVEAVVYLSAQRGYKRNHENARCQMEILRGVPHSYFLIKGVGDEQSVQDFFFELADEVGVSRDRLRFLPEVASELEHRANLAVADVVLDTFPYNGATTTLETLWVGVPLVTQVGQQFSARNSYTMLVNAGIEEGIAWNEEEYIEWGIRLGQDAHLREQIHLKLRRSRRTAPLWNGKAFAREMEKAYAEMWQAHTARDVL